MNWMKPDILSTLSLASLVSIGALAGAAELRAQEPGTAARPVTATGCVLPVERVRGGNPPSTTRPGTPRFILMNANITRAGAAVTSTSPGGGERSGTPSEGPVAGGGSRGAGRSAQPSGNPSGRTSDEAAGLDRPSQGPPTSTAANRERQYLLQGTADFTRHVGQHVEVTGMLEPITNNPARTDTPADVQTSGNPILQVTALKSLGKPCSA